MNQQMLDLTEPGCHWIRTRKGDTSCRLLADRHYSRQHIGAAMFCRPGKNIVLRTAQGNATWVSWQGIRDDGLDAWECTIFRNESEYRSSDLIREAVGKTIQIWGELPKDGFITYVDASKVKSHNPGCCFKKAGFKHIGQSKVRGLILLQYTAEMARLIDGVVSECKECGIETMTPDELMRLKQEWGE